MIWLLFPAFMAAATVSQSQLAPSAATVDVNVVELDVVVLDAAGKPVPNLTRDDFQLFVDKKKRPISNFYAIDPVPSSSGVAAAAAHATDAVPERRDFVTIFVDDRRLTQSEKKRTLDALRGFVRDHVHAGTAAMIVTADASMRVVQRFTEDPALLTNAIDAIEKLPSHGEEYVIQRRQVMRMIEDFRPKAGDRGDNAEIALQELKSFVRGEEADAQRTMDALEQLVHTISGLDGRRVLVYVSAGLPLQPGAEIFQWYKPEEFLHDPALAQQLPMDAMSANLSAAVLRLARETAMAGVQFFAIDPRGPRGFDEETPTSGRLTSTAATQLDSNLIRSNLHGPIQLLADETGGRAIVDENDMNLAFAKLDDHLKSYYSIGFRSDNSGTEDDVEVRVKKRGFTVRAAKHVRERNTREQIADRVRASLYAPIEDNPLAAGVELTPLTGSQSGVKATISVPIGKLSVLPGQNGIDTSIVVFVTMLDADMRETPVRMFKHHVSANEVNDSVQSLPLNAPPGTYTLSFAIVDAYSSQTSFLQREITIR